MVKDMYYLIKKATLFVANKKPAFNHWVRRIRKRLREKPREIHLSKLQTDVANLIIIVILVGLLKALTDGASQEQLKLLETFFSLSSIILFGKINVHK